MFLLAFLGTLQLQNNHKMVQLAWNYMIDSYRTPVHLLYPPEAIACACIHLSARILQVPLPNKPAWYMVFDVLEDDLQKMCIEILSVYTFEKPDVEKLEIIVADVFKKQQVAKLKAKGLAALNDILMKNPLLSSSTSVSSSDGLSPNAEKENQDCNGIISLRMEEAKHQKRSRMDEANHQKMSKRSRQTSPSGDHHHSSSRKSYASRSSVHSHERIHHHSSSREKSYKYHHGSRSSVRSQEHLHHHSGSRGKLHKYQRAGRSPVYKHDRHHHSRSYTESRKSCYASPLTVHNHKHEHYSISLAR